METETKTQTDKVIGLNDKLVVENISVKMQQLKEQILMMTN